MNLAHLASLCLGAQLTAISVIDLRSLRIPNILNAALAATGLIAAWILDRSVLNSVIGAAAGYGAMWGFAAGYRALRGRDGLGMGDAKLLAGVGAWVGWMGLPFVVVLGAALGIVYVAFRRISGERVTGAHALAFGPFIAIGAAVVWVVQLYAYR